MTLERGGSKRDIREKVGRGAGGGEESELMIGIHAGIAGLLGRYSSIPHLISSRLSPQYFIPFLFDLREMYSLWLFPPGIINSGGLTLRSAPSLNSPGSITSTSLPQPPLSAYSRTD